MKIIRLNEKRKSDRGIYKIILAFFLLIFVLIPPSSALFNDEEKSVDNSFHTSHMNAVLRSNTDTPETSVSDEENDGFVSKSIFFRNTSDMDYKYKQSVEKMSGDKEFCNNIEVKVEQKWYDQEGTLQADQKYTGDLVDYWLIGENTDIASVLENYYTNGKYLENELWFSFEFSVKDAALVVEDTTCDFDIRVKLWQEDMYFGEGFFDTETVSLSVKSKEFMTTNDTSPEEIITEEQNEEVEENI